MRDWMRRLVSWLTPWYSENAVKRREASTEAVRQRSISARIHSEQVIADYRAADERIAGLSGNHG